ncbi:MAG: DNA cytosine methyltransferase, partial [Paludibacter sp.]
MRFQYKFSKAELFVKGNNVMKISSKKDSALKEGMNIIKEYKEQEVDSIDVSLEDPQLSLLGDFITRSINEKNKGNILKPRLVSLFSGCGGLDLGFEKAGFDVIWANEYDKDIWKTFELNHSQTILDKRSITQIEIDEIPECDGIIGGPPCQSWSEGGAKRGIEDKRGQLFYDFIRILKSKQPLFFLAENVSGMLLDRHKDALEEIKQQFSDCGYNLSFSMLNASDYNVPQDRKRVFFVGYRKDLNIKFEFPKPTSNKEKRTLTSAIADLQDSAIPSSNGIGKQQKVPKIPNHEYMTGDFSSIYMSRNRVRSWDEV